MEHGQAFPDTRLVLPPALVRKHSRRWLWWLLGAAVGVAVAVALMLRARRTSTSQFRTAPVVRRTVIRVVEAMGRLDVTSRVDVPAPAEGILQRIFVKAGESVNEGQALVQLDTEQASVAVRNARSSVRASTGRLGEAEATLEAARDVRERTERLADRGLASDGELARARTEEAKAAAAVRTARAALSTSRESASAAESGERALTLRAPIGGIVLRAPDWSGDVVTPEKGPLVVVGTDPSVLRVDASVAEADVGLVRIGQPAQFTVPAFPERTFHGRVEQRATEPEHTGTATSYVATLSVPNPDHALLPGMTATVRVEVARAENALAVREAALRFAPVDASPAPPRTRVFRLGNDRRIEPIDVLAGISDGAFAQVTPRSPGALTPGDLVVIGLMEPRNQEPGGPGISLGRRQ